MFLLEESVVLMQLSDFVIFELVGGGELGDLLIEEDGVGLVFVT